MCLANNIRKESLLPRPIRSSEGRKMEGFDDTTIGKEKNIRNYHFKHESILKSNWIGIFVVIVSIVNQIANL